jgi:large subunit ribosomal protein L5
MSNQSLQVRYKKEIAPKLKEQFNVSSQMAVPRITMVKVNVGIGRWLNGAKDFSELEQNLAAITGQKPVVAKAKKSISNFKLREGMPVGLAVTLRGARAHQFMDKFINVAAPRIRDFRGITPRAFDGKGNYSLGIKDYQIFPEINPEKVIRTTGLQITIVTNTESDEQAKALLTAMNFPFTKPKKD